MIEIESGGALHNGMSLFQDLKLKRRKVDSRCSSDGESIGTSESTSSLSPDAQAQSEGSPKDKDRCVTPEELVVSSQSKPSFPPQFFFMMKAERGKEGLPPPSGKTNGVIKLTSLHGHNGTLKHMMKAQLAEMNGNHMGRMKDHKMRNGEMLKNDLDIRRSMTNSSNSNSDEELDRKSIKSEKLTILDEEEKDLEMAVDDENDNDSGANMSPPMLSRPVSNSSASGNSASNSPPGPRLESTLIITKANKEGLGHLHRLSPPQNHLHARLTSPMPTPHQNGNYGNEMRMNAVPSPLVHAELRNLAERPDPLSVVTSTSLSFHHQSMYRINGVRPEVISGGAVTPAQQPPVTNGIPPSRKSPSLSRSPNSSPRSNSSHTSSTPGSLHSPSSRETLVAGGSLVNSSSSTTSSNGSSSNHHHVNLNRTPTVIMGEAGGVRTMLWSQPGQPMANPPEVGLGMPSSPPTTNGLMSNGAQNGNGNYRPMGTHGNSSPPNPMKGPLSMERLWRDSEAALNLSTGRTNGGTNGLMNGHHAHNGPNNHMSMNGHGGQTAEDEDYEQPMICMICEDRATGLHYGIITCEGCKGFFKRTVQNRRVYTCVADGTCEITKAQRNRCQYCRFKKCIEQGMVLQAVREDRMPGGRNSGAVYNLYKVPVKYRKHKKGNRVNGKNGTAVNGEAIKTPNLSPPMIPAQSGGNILKAALTSPNEVNHLRPAPLPFDTAAAMITHLVQCDNFHDIAALQNWEELLEARGELSDKLCQMGDSIVCRLVQWAKRLPFYQELSTEVHTRVLTHKWHELLVLTTSAWQAMHTPSPHANLTAEEETMENLQLLQRCLQAMMGRSLTLEQLRQDVGQMVERLTFLTRSFRRLGVRIEEYVTLKVIAMLQGTKGGEVGAIQERYIKCLRTFLEVTCPSHPNRLSDLLRTLPEVQAAASLLLESKMFYVPFLLNSALLQR